MNKQLHTLACDVAEQALAAERAAGREPDPRSWTAIQAKRDWLEGKIGDAELQHARREAADDHVGPGLTARLEADKCAVRARLRVTDSRLLKLSPAMAVVDAAYSASASAARAAWSAASVDDLGAEASIGASASAHEWRCVHRLAGLSDPTLIDEDGVIAAYRARQAAQARAAASARDDVVRAAKSNPTQTGL